jgi:hypothetical protein
VRAWLAAPITAKDLIFIILAYGAVTAIKTCCTVWLKLTQHRIDVAMMKARYEMQIALERERRNPPDRPQQPPDKAA